MAETQSLELQLKMGTEPGTPLWDVGTQTAHLVTLEGCGGLGPFGCDYFLYFLPSFVVPFHILGFEAVPSALQYRMTIIGLLFSPTSGPVTLPHLLERSFCLPRFVT